MINPITNTQILDVLAEMSAWLLAGRCTGGPWARNARSYEVTLRSGEAASVCLRTALCLAANYGSDSPEDEIAVEELLLTTLEQWNGGHSLAQWNDLIATDAEVQELLSRAAHSLSSK